MKEIIGVILILGGIVLGLYVGVWLMFIGGIVQVLEQVRAENLEAIKIAYGIARIMFAGLIGLICGFALILPGRALLGDWKDNKPTPHKR